MPAAAITDATKRYRKVTALDGFSLSIERGEIVALIGPNGAGKTTAINALLGLIPLNSGTAELYDQTPARALYRIGVTPQDAALPFNLTVREAARFVAAHYRAPKQVDGWLSEMGLSPLASRLCRDLSGGQRRTLAVAVAFIGNPELVLLDEPTTGLDVAARQKVWNVIRAFGEAGGSVLITTHDIHEPERLATRVAVINRGRNVSGDFFSRLHERASQGRIEFKADHMPSVAQAGVHVFHQNGSYAMVGATSDDLVRQLVAADVPFKDLKIIPFTLEAALVEMIEHNATA